MPLSNQMLQQTEDQIETGLTPDTSAAYTKIVVAGMHAALDKGPDSILAQLQKSRDPISDAAKGAVSLVFILRKQAQGVMPMKAAVPAAMTLMLKALDFIDRAGIAKIGQPELVRATHIFTDFMFARTGITKQGLANVAGKVNDLIQDPAALQAIRMKAGVIRHPLSATATPLPPDNAPAGLINGATAG